MKKDKIKSLIKSARKTVRESIKSSLISDLKAVTGKLGTGSKNLEKEIEKGAKLLAKKISKEIIIDEAALVAANEGYQAPVDDKTAPAKPTVEKTEKTVAPKVLPVVKAAPVKKVRAAKPVVAAEEKK